VTHDDSPSRAEGKTIEMHVLRQIAGNAIDGAIETDGRIAKREPADLCGRCDVALDQGG